MSQTEKKIPAFIAYHVPDRENATWTRIGAAGKHKDGDGFTLDLELMPLATGRIVLRTFVPKQELQQEGEARKRSLSLQEKTIMKMLTRNIIDTVQNGDCIDVMNRMEPNSIDFILTDPPYLCRYRSRDGQRVVNDDNDT